MSNYVLVSNGDLKTIVANIDGSLYSAGQEHPCWNTIKTKCEDGTITAQDFDAVAGITEFMELVDGFAIENGVLTLNGEAMNGTFSKKVVDSYAAGEGSHALTNFVSKLDRNPSRNSRDQLFRWLDRSGFELDDEGWIVGYKAVNMYDGEFWSISAGTASVNGVQHTGHIPQLVGDIVQMPRSEVTDNPSIGCSYGLHVGTLSFAKGFGGTTVLRVAVSPADVVSVPDVANCEKMRVCEYRVVGVHSGLVVGVESHVVDIYSSFINYVEYEPSGDGHGTLTVNMKNGSTYRYAHVPKSVFDNFEIDDDDLLIVSPGEYYNEYVKDVYTRI